VGAGRAAEGTAAPAAATAAGAAHAAVTAADSRTSLIFCQSLHFELCHGPAYDHRLHQSCPQAVPDVLLLLAWNQPVGQRAENDELRQTAVEPRHH